MIVVDFTCIIINDVNAAIRIEGFIFSSERSNSVYTDYTGYVVTTSELWVDLILKI